MKQFARYSWLIQLIATTVILLFGFNYTNGKNCQLLNQTALKSDKNEMDIVELRKTNTMIYEEMLREIHKIDKSLEHLTVDIEYLKGKQ